MAGSVTHVEGMPDEAYLAAHTRQFSLRDGTRLRVRPILPSDRDALRAGFEQLSPESRYRRFLTPVGHLSEAMLDYFTEIDYRRHFALAAQLVEAPDQPGIAVARYVCDPDDPGVAEPAVAVVDAYQGLGLGTLLLDMLIAAAIDNGVRRFRASLLDDNGAMRHLFEESGAELIREGPGVLRAEFALPRREMARLRLAYDLLRHACEGSVTRARRVFAGES